MQRADCWCDACLPIDDERRYMIVCPECGNKRCPKASHHANACTHSNEPGQPGSVYGLPDRAFEAFSGRPCGVGLPEPENASEAHAVSSTGHPDDLREVVGRMARTLRQIDWRQREIQAWLKVAQDDLQKAQQMIDLRYDDGR